MAENERSGLAAEVTEYISRAEARFVTELITDYPTILISKISVKGLYLNNLEALAVVGVSDYAVATSGTSCGTMPSYTTAAEGIINIEIRQRVRVQ